MVHLRSDSAFGGRLRRKMSSSSVPLLPGWHLERALHHKSASQQEYKHYANTLRKLFKKNELVGFHQELTATTRGKDMLLMERTEKRSAFDRKTETPVEVRLTLIERTPLQEPWENVLEIMRRNTGPDLVKA